MTTIGAHAPPTTEAGTILFENDSSDILIMKLVRFLLTVTAVSDSD